MRKKGWCWNPMPWLRDCARQEREVWTLLFYQTEELRGPSQTTESRMSEAASGHTEPILHDISSTPRVIQPHVVNTPAVSNCDEKEK